MFVKNLKDLRKMQGKSQIQATILFPLISSQKPEQFF